MTEEHIPWTLEPTDREEICWDEECTKPALFKFTLDGHPTYHCAHLARILIDVVERDAKPSAIVVEALQ